MPSFFWTPHSGYHWNGSFRRFFEGWYVRLTLPEPAATFAFMYSIDDPAGQSALSGGAAQILGPDEAYLYAPMPDPQTFWAWPHRLGLGHWHESIDSSESPRCLSAQDFFQTVQQGYQLTATQHQGHVQDIETGAIARWDYHVEPIYGWGAPTQTQLPTAGWLSYLPVFEPGWQVLMAHGLATGWAEWQGTRYEFHRAPTYAEKNWGGAFPQRWFWIQANAFESEPDLSITAVGGLRQVFNRSETVGLVGLHFAGRSLCLSSLKASIAWQVKPWGHWQMTLEDHRYRVQLEGTVEQAPTQVRVPTRDGLQFECWDTTQGHLTVEVWQRSPHAPDSLSPILKAQTTLAALEVGGRGWHQTWDFQQSAI